MTCLLLGMTCPLFEKAIYCVIRIIHEQLEVVINYISRSLLGAEIVQQTLNTREDMLRAYAGVFDVSMI